MTRRSRAREVALQLLFQYDLNTKPLSRKALETFANDRLQDEPEAVAFCLLLTDGVIANRAEIDAKLAATADNWKLHRMLPVDRNVLRIGVYEMLHAAEKTPPAAAINEALELSRRYGTVDSPAFINGILDKINKSQPAAQ
ncbi:transcription antitermination factor NusB [soil metagenome]